MDKHFSCDADSAGSADSHLFDDAAEVPEVDISIDNDDATDNNKPFNLIPPIDNDFYGTNILIDDSSDSSINLPYDDLVDKDAPSRPPPEPPPNHIPEITFASTAPILRSMRENANYFHNRLSPLCLTCTSDNSNTAHTCDCVMESNAMLSSIVSYDDTEPLLFPSPAEKSVECTFPLTKSQDQPLTTLKSLSTVDILNALSSNPSSRKLKYRDTIMLLQARQIDGGANKSMTNSLDNLEAYWEIEPVPMKGVSSEIKIMHTYRGIYNLVARAGNIIPILMFYSPQASHCIISPNDAVATSCDFSSWTQHSNIDTGVGHIRFSSASGLISEYVDLQKSNNLWFLNTSRCNIKLNSQANFNTVNSLSKDLQCKLWITVLRIQVTTPFV